MTTGKAPAAATERQGREAAASGGWAPASIWKMLAAHFALRAGEAYVAWGPAFAR
jgi:hypothetical protein